MSFFERLFDKEKHIIRSGFGSPGDTARTLTVWYKNFKRESPLKTRKELFEDVYEFRTTIFNEMGTTDNLYLDFNSARIIEYCNEDMALFSFICSTLDTHQFRTGLVGSQDVIILVLDVIKEEIVKIDPSLITLSDNHYKSKALEFTSSILKEYL